ncbi:hypothetical protein IF2G_08944 [Cordyceps javanica]|nr:hypothetical protein IF2G_08944 [Cordyceps javanica]
MMPPIYQEYVPQAGCLASPGARRTVRLRMLHHLPLPRTSRSLSNDCVVTVRVQGNYACMSSQFRLYCSIRDLD